MKYKTDLGIQRMDFEQPHWPHKEQDIHLFTYDRKVQMHPILLAKGTELQYNQEPN